MNSDFIFNRMMEYIIKDDFDNAKRSAISDISKQNENPISFMIINTAKDNLELIKIMAGFNSMNNKIKNYYNNPEQALIDYKL